eukprot:scaffold76036_cov71-Cyclotella_meneghiniana.AAC.4
MGVVGKLPIALAPGMGMNAYFTYSVVGCHLLRACIVGVEIQDNSASTRAFLAHLGLQAAEGIGAVVGDTATIVGLGACPPENQVLLVAYDDLCKDQGICISGGAYTCDGGVMTHGRTWLGILGLMIIAIGMTYRSKLSFIYGIGLITVISWFRGQYPEGTPVTYFPYTDEGNARFEYFKKVVDITGLDLIITPFTTNLANIGLALFTMLYVDFLDTSGTLLGIANSMGVIDEEGNFEGSTQAYCVDALATMIGSLFGLSTITSYIESGAGVQAGSKTGLTAVFVGFYFFIAIFFAPILSSIPPWAIGGALILVGALMARSLTKLKFDKVSHAISGFLTMMVMPLTYSISYGLLAGIGSYVVIEGICWILSLVGLKAEADANGNAEPSKTDEQIGKARMGVDEEEGIEEDPDIPAQ